MKTASVTPSTAPRIRVLLADDHAVVRAGYRFLLENLQDIEIVGEASSAEEALTAYTRLLPDVLVMDITMPGVGGMEGSRRLLAKFSDARILMFTMHETPVLVEHALQAGVFGFISKNSSPDVLVTAVRRIAAGEVYVDAELAQTLISQHARGRGSPIHGLSARELEILRMFAEARSIEDIATMLSLSQKTISNYLTQIKEKLQVSNSAELIRMAVTNKLVVY